MISWTALEERKGTSKFFLRNLYNKDVKGKQPEVQRQEKEKKKPTLRLQPCQKRVPGE